MTLWTITEDEPWGSLPLLDHGKCRLVLQNINGIKDQDDHSSTKVMLQHAIDIQATVLGLIETNVNWKFKSTKQSFTTELNKFWKRTSCSVSHSDYHFRGRGQPGGTATVVASPWASRSKIGTDPSGLGRWSTATLRGRDNRKITIITAYRVEGTATTKGPFTAFSQQRLLLESRNAVCKDPKEAFFLDLGKYINQLQEENQEVIIMMDANASTQHNNRFRRWIKDHKLVDPHNLMHGIDDQPASFQGGSSRIDYFLTTPQISEYVTSAGILPFYAYYESDHRAMFLDVDIEAYLKGKPQDIMSPDSRGINGKHPAAIKVYQTELKKFFATSDLETILTNMADQINKGTPLSHYQLLELDALEELFTKACLAAENKCRRIDKSPWSPVLKSRYNAVRYWKLWLKETLTNINLGPARANIPVFFSVPTMIPARNEIQHALRNAQKQFKAAQNNAPELREKFLQSQADMYSINHNTKATHEIQNIIRSEAMVKIHNRIRQVMGKLTPPPMTHLLVADQHGQVQPEFDSTILEHMLQQRNLNHFRQADNTDFAQGIIPTLLGPDGTSEKALQVLSGTLPREFRPLPKATLDILVKCKRVPDLPTIDNKITKFDLIQGYKKWRASTSTSPSGRHLGHDKAALRQLSKPKKNERLFQDEYFSIKALFLNLAIENTHVYNRWTTVVNAMIEKVPGRPTIDKLRVIHLIESDINLTMGIMWSRRLLHQVENSGILSNAQGGGRADRRCQDVLLFKHSMYSILRLTKTNGSTFDNDAKSCYDRIVMLLASLIGQSLGMCPKICQLFLAVLSKTQYHAKTAYGISPLSYGTTDEYTIHGPGQGGRASPSIWTLISSIILSCMEDHIDGATITCPHSKTTVKAVSSGFVDDITHWTVDMPRSLRLPETDTDTLEILSETQRGAQYWTNLLYSTGGLLEIPKCLYYAIIWQFDDEGIAHIDDHTRYSESVTLTDPSSNSQFHIRSEDGYTSHKTLGALECPGGHYKDEHNRLQEKANNFATRILTNGINAKEAWTMFKTTYIPSMTYSLVVGTLTEKQAAKIQGKPIQAFLSSMGYNRTTPHAVVYGPPEIGGIGLNHLFAEQGMIKSLYLMRHIRQATELGQTLLIQLQWAQLIAGITQPILEYPDTPLPQLQEELWIQTLRDFLDKSELKLHIPTIHTPTPHRQHDICLMERISQFSILEIQRINRCRIYLKAEHISDISDASGTHIRQNAFLLIREDNVFDKRLWPRQEQPGPQHIRTWHKFLLQFLKSPGKTLELKQHLGQWLQHSHNREAQILYDTTLGWLIRQNSGITARYEKIQWKRRSMIGTNLIPCESPDDSWTLINIDVIHDTIDTCEVRLPSDILPTQVTRFSTHTWSQYLLSLPKLDQFLLQNVTLTNKILPMFELMKLYKNTITIVSDGSVINQSGTFGWVIATDNYVIATNNGHCFGQPMNSHRAEYIGMLSWIIFIRRYIEFFEPETKCTIEAYCDNISVVNSANYVTNRKTKDALEPNYDVANEVRQQLTSLRKTISTSIQHIKGHQDEKRPIHELSWQSQLNIQADHLASASQSNPKPTPDLVIHIPSNQIYLQCGNKIICSGEQHMLRWRWRELKLQDYYQDRFRITNTTLHNMNWAAMSLVRRKKTIPTKFMIKFLIDWLPTGTRLEKYGNQVFLCPLCQLDEDANHILLCKNRTCQQNHFITALLEHLKKIHTIASIRTTMIHGLTQFITGTTIEQPDDLTFDKDLFQAQNSIGWHFALRGLFAMEWSIKQEHHNQNTLGDSWQSKVNEFILQQMHQLWQERNKLIHETATNGELRRVDEETVSQVHYLYECVSEISPQDADELLSVPIDQRLSFTTATNQEWAKQTLIIMKNRMQQWKQKLQQGQLDIRQFVTNQRLNTRTKHKNTQSQTQQHTTTRDKQKTLLDFFKRSTHDNTQTERTQITDGSDPVAQASNTTPPPVRVSESQGQAPKYHSDRTLK